MKLGTYFTLAEMTKTNTGIKNEPNGSEINALSDLVFFVLDPLREKYGKPITVTSGFRSLQVNQKIGGASSSQHTKGEAADIKSENNALLFSLIRESGMFDQLIWEFGNDKQPDWLHVSFRRGRNRKQVLRAKKVNGRTSYISI